MVVGSGWSWRPVGAMWRCACVVALLCAALTRCNAIKRAEKSPVPFVLGSRYGRSPPRLIAPRNDRSDLFFMGSRYGKRSEAGPPCDCSRYTRHAQPRNFFNRGLEAPRPVPTRD